jgi:rhomboid protease GluP
MKQFLKKYFYLQPITTIFLILNFVMVILTLFYGGFKINVLLKLGGLYPPLVTEYNEYYRLITTAFLHGNIIHFLLNGFALFYLGGELERLIGGIRFIIIYILSALGASIATVLLSPNYVTVGASGAIYGVVGALLVLTFTRKEWFYSTQIRALRNLIVINIVFTLLMPSISTEGHIGGMIIGFIVIQFLTPNQPYLYKKNSNWIN